MISPVCTEATSAKTRVAWTEVLVHARNLVDN
jgi:hypothetical protein